MRKLTAPDLFAGVRLIKKMGVKEDARELAKKSDDLAQLWDNGFDFVWGLFDKLTDQDGEGALYDLLAGPYEMTPEQVRALPIAEHIENLQTLARENDLLDFFKRAARLAAK